MKIESIRWSALIILISLVALVHAEDKPKVTASVVICEKVTLIDLEAKDKPLFDVISEIAKKMGYDKVVDKEKVTDGAKFSCSFKQKPGFECLTEVCQKNNLVFGGAGIGEDFALGIYKQGKWKSHIRPAGGFAAVFAQAPAGTPFNDPFRRPFSLRILTEPTLSCTFKTPTIVDQKNAVDKACDLIALQAVPFGVQEGLGKDSANPWPELSVFTLKTTAEIAKKKVVAAVSGLSMNTAAFPVQNEGKDLFTITKVGAAGNFLTIDIAVASDSKARGVMQGGWGQPLGPSIEAAIGARIDFTDTKGAPVSIGVVAWEGDGTTQKVTFKFPKGKLDGSGGIPALTLKYSRIVEKEETPLEFQFKDLGTFKP